MTTTPREPTLDEQIAWAQLGTFVTAKRIDMTERGIEYVHGCSRCDAAHRRLPTAK